MLKNHFLGQNDDLCRLEIDLTRYTSESNEIEIIPDKIFLFIQVQSV